MESKIAKPKKKIRNDDHQDHKRAMITRLRRVEGQIRGIQGMIETDSSCEAVAQQVAAARRALDRAFYELIACTMEMEIKSAASVGAAKSAGAHVAKLLAKYG
ncbi:MAG: metal-sensing transcriptional repressor [Gammaproteobacteria bacterium]|nr:metal-sensing transcriptional repressor [Gammaproteobacteria bacterium]